MFGSLLGSLANVVSSAEATPSGSPPAPSSPASPTDSNSTSAASPASAAAPAPNLEPDPFTRSAYFQRLLKRDAHDDERISAIKEAALRDVPPREPGPEECCNEGCALDWRDLHPDWKSIRRRLKEDEEDRQREAEEEAALNGEEPPEPSRDKGGAARRRAARGKPSVEIAVEKEEGPSVEKVGRRFDEPVF
ncbi:hypothetical protein JCM8208_001444 [Rhodotorula glutinis]